MVTLRQFIKIASSIIIPELCIVHLEYEDEYYGEDTKTLLRCFNSISELDPYLDYEIVDFHQDYFWGELDTQYIALREVKQNVQSIQN